jgi:ElaB/YqjD/DUF883 family membrane-anchored ribosome-binding protein
MTETNAEASGQEGLTAQASEKVQEATSVAQEKASELREQGSSRLREQLDQRSTQVGSQVRSVGEALRRSGNDLTAEGNSGAAQFTDQAADRLERLGGYLEQKSGDDFLRDVEEFARRRPWMLAGLGLFAGVAAARFMKASSDERYGAYGPSSQHGNSTSQVSSPSAIGYSGASPVAGGSTADSASGYKDTPLVTEESLQTSRARSSR